MLYEVITLDVCGLRHARRRSGAGRLVSHGNSYWARACVLGFASPSYFSIGDGLYRDWVTIRPRCISPQLLLLQLPPEPKLFFDVPIPAFAGPDACCFDGVITSYSIHYTKLYDSYDV